MTQSHQLTVTDCFPEDAGDALLLGRVWVPGDVSGPSPCLVTPGSVYDLSGIAPTMSGLLERDTLVADIRDATDLPRLGDTADILSASHYSNANNTNLHFLSPCDLQVVKASGVTFITSLLERVIEEQARGDKSSADAFRKDLIDVIGDELTNLKPGSPQAAALKETLIEKGIWSQYLEVGIGPQAEVFTKCPPLASVGIGAEIGVRPDSSWNNPEPEIVLAVNSKREIVGATLGNDVNLRDFEGRSALLLGEAKDNNASASIGPFIRLFDDKFSMDDVRNADIVLKVSGTDGFTLDGASSMSQISRDPEELVGHACGPHHQYPDGFMLYLGTMFAPVKDRDAEGSGFTHKVGDQVEISTPKLGRLVNWVDQTDKAPPWTFGISALMQNLAARGLV